MTQLKNKNLYLISFFALLFSLLIFNRWFYTPLGANSFGRIWFYYVDYFNFGYIKRGFLGTTFSIGNFNQIFTNKYCFAYLIYGCSFFCFFVTVTVFFAKSTNLTKNLWLLLAIFFSPTFFPHLSYITGTTDLYLLTIFFISCFYIRKLKFLIIITSIAFFIHEIYIVFIPALIYIKKNSSLQLSDKNRIISNSQGIWLFFGIFSIAIFILILKFGSLKLNQIDYEQIMHSKLGFGSENHVFWSGFWELTTDAKANLNVTLPYYKDLISNHKKIFILSAVLNLSYLLYLFYVMFSINKISIFEKLIYILIVIFPCILIPFANDMQRWLSFSCDIMLFHLIYLIKYNNKNTDKGKNLFIILAAFILISPFGYGNDPTRFFPIQQMVIEKIYNPSPNAIIR